MAGNKNKTKKNSSKPNPLSVRPRRVPRPIVNFDGSTLHGTHFATRDLTAANVASHNVVIDCSSFFGSVSAVKIIEGISRDLSGITTRFQEYRFKSVTMKWLPHVAPGVADGGSSITIAYMDSPESVVNTIAQAAAVDISTTKGIRNVQTFNAWQGFTYKVPLTYRRKWFAVNTSTNYTIVSEADTTVQGLVVWGLASLSAAVDLGVMHSVFELELRGLNTTLNT